MKKDKFGQHKKPWTEFDYELLSILEEIDATDPIDSDKSLSAYVTDIKELIREYV